MRLKLSKEVLRHETEKLQYEGQTRCLRKTVVCVAFRPDGVIVASARNGPSSSSPCSNEVGACGCAHAEIRCLLAVARLDPIVDSISLVCTYAPCTNCANAIVDSKFVGEVYFQLPTFHDLRGIEILRVAGIEVYQL